MNILKKHNSTNRTALKSSCKISFSWTRDTDLPSDSEELKERRQTWVGSDSAALRSGHDPGVKSASRPSPLDRTNQRLLTSSLTPHPEQRERDAPGFMADVLKESRTDCSSSLKQTWETMMIWRHKESKRTKPLVLTADPVTDRRMWMDSIIWWEIFEISVISWCLYLGTF